MSDEPFVLELSMYTRLVLFNVFIPPLSSGCEASFSSHFLRFRNFFSDFFIGCHCFLYFFNPRARPDASMKVITRMFFFVFDSDLHH